MGVRIFVGHEGSLNGVVTERALLICSTSDTAFGPVMESYEVAEAFLTWHNENHHEDVRVLASGELESRYLTFKVTRDRYGENEAEANQENQDCEVRGSLSWVRHRRALRLQGVQVD
jgi:hypothetical protein